MDMFISHQYQQDKWNAFFVIAFLESDCKADVSDDRSLYECL